MKKNKKTKIGIILIVLQLFVITFQIITGQIYGVISTDVPAKMLGNLIGYFLPTIIGVILIVKGQKE